MAKKISQLVAASAAAAANEYEINEAGTSKKVTGAQIKTFVQVGTTTNDNAVAGAVGEVLSSTVVAGSAIALTSNTAANVTSLSLTAGDWDVYGAVYFLPGATTSVTLLYGSVSQTTATIDTTPGAFANQVYASAGVVLGNTGTPTIVVPVIRKSLASTTTMFLPALATFTVSTLSAYGTIWARRAR